MKNRKRRDEARHAAERIAPGPQSSFLMHGIVGTGLAILAIVAVGRFYNVDPFAVPVWAGAIVLIALVWSVLLRLIWIKDAAARAWD
jgi:hypothetical protein